jgi:hypothetical protein
MDLFTPSLNIYLNEFSSDLIRKVLDRLNKFDMRCEINPVSNFATPGYVSFRFRFKKFNTLHCQHNVFVGGFRLQVRNFDWHNYKNSLELDDCNIFRELMQCHQVLTFEWDPLNVFELRFAFLTSAIIAELTHGICHYPGNNAWLTSNNIVKQAWDEVRSFERIVALKNISFDNEYAPTETLGSRFRFSYLECRNPFSKN